MAQTNAGSNNTDPFDIHRFLSAQADVYHTALSELRKGQKRTHWMWFIFPQIAGLGHSSTSQYYAITSQEEARHYLAHPVLGQRLVECAEAILACTSRSASAIFGSPDDMKLKSSMTLFETVAPPDSVFSHVLDRYFQGQRDSNTLKRLREQR